MQADILHSDLSPVSLHDIRSTENLQRLCSNFTLHSYHATAVYIINETPRFCKGFFYNFLRIIFRTIVIFSGTSANK
jgi:hypothetical protein